MMESAHILMLSPDTELVETINKLIRNSGISVYIDNCKSLNQWINCVKQGDYSCAIVDGASLEPADLTPYVECAREADLHLVLLIGNSDPAWMEASTRAGALTWIDRASPDTIAGLIRRLSHSAHTAESNVHHQASYDELKEQFRSFMESSSIPVAFVHEGLHIYANPAYRAWVGVADTETLSMLSIMDLVKPVKGDFRRLLRDLGEGRFPEGPVPAEFIREGGPAESALLAFSAATHEGEQCIQITIHRSGETDVNVTTPQAHPDLDSHTGFLSRKAATALLQAELSELTGEDDRLALVYIEPEHHEDLLHRMGIIDFDRFLEDFGRLVCQSCGPEDQVSRLTEAGFLIFARPPTVAHARSIPESLSKLLSDTDYETENHSFSIACSAGITLVGQMNRGIDEAISQVRTAHSQARNDDEILALYKPAMRKAEGGEDQANWSERIRFALDNGSFFTLQQPVVNLEGDGEGLFEARAFMHEDEADLPGYVYLPRAEDADLGSAIDRFLIPGILGPISGTGDRHIITLSRNSVVDFSFPSWFHHLMEEQDVEGTQVVFQISAATVLSHLRQFKRLCDELRPLGCGFALSDFDDSKRILDLLDKARIDLVRLRLGLADSLRSSAATREVVQRIVRSAEQTGTGVIVQDVRDAADLAALWQCGVKLVSGDFLKDSAQLAG